MSLTSLYASWSVVDINNYVGPSYEWWDGRFQIRQIKMNKVSSAEQMLTMLSNKARLQTELHYLRKKKTTKKIPVHPYKNFIV